MKYWAHGLPDKDPPLAPPGSTAFQDGVMVPLTTPEQYMIGSINSIPPEQQPHQQQPDGEPQLDQGGGKLKQEIATSWVDLNAQRSQNC